MTASPTKELEQPLSVEFDQEVRDTDLQPKMTYRNEIARVIWSGDSITVACKLTKMHLHQHIPNIQRSMFDVRFATSEVERLLIRPTRFRLLLSFVSEFIRMRNECANRS